MYNCEILVTVIGTICRILSFIVFYKLLKLPFKIILLIQQIISLQ